MFSKDKIFIKAENLKRLNYRGFFIISMLIAAAVWFFMLQGNPNGLQRFVFFENQNDWFMDFYNTVNFAAEGKPYTDGGGYLPLAYVLLSPVAKLIMYTDAGKRMASYLARYTQLGGIAGMVYLAISFGILFYVLYKCTRGKEYQRIGILTALFLSGVTLFNFDRANLLILTAAFLFIFLYSQDSESAIIRHIGLLSIALAAVLKIFPCFFGVLFLYKKKYKELLLVILYGLLMSIVPFFFLKEGFIKNVYKCIESMTGFTQKVDKGTIGGGNFFSFSGVIIINADNIIPQFVGKIICLAALVFAKYIKKDWKKILLISLSMIMFSGTQLKYCTIYLYYPIVLFFNDKHTKRDIIYLISFILVLIPVQFSAKIGIFWIENFRVTNTIYIVLTTLLTAEGVYRMFKSKRRKKAAAALEAVSEPEPEIPDGSSDN